VYEQSTTTFYDEILSHNHSKIITQRAMAVGIVQCGSVHDG